MQFVFAPPARCSRLRRDEFKYTKICVLLCSYVILFRPSGEAILGTLKYSSSRSLMYFFRASGEAILGTQRYFIPALYPSTLSKHFMKALYQSTLSTHFVQALYEPTVWKHFINALCPSTLSKHIIKQLYQSTSSKHFIRVDYQQSGRVVLKLFKNYPATVLQMY